MVVVPGHRRKISNVSSVVMTKAMVYLLFGHLVVGQGYRSPFANPVPSYSPSNATCLPTNAQIDVASGVPTFGFLLRLEA